MTWDDLSTELSHSGFLYKCRFIYNYIDVNDSDNVIAVLCNLNSFLNNLCIFAKSLIPVLSTIHTS